MLCTMDASDETLSEEDLDGENEGALDDQDEAAFYERQRREQDDLEGLRHRQVAGAEDDDDS